MNARSVCNKTQVTESVSRRNKVNISLQPIPPSLPDPPHPTNSGIINVSLLNVRSLNNKCDVIRDFIIDNHLHVFCIVETWLKEGHTSVIASFLPDTHVFYHFPRPESKGKTGGGVGIVLSKNFKNVKAFNRVYNRFECIETHATYHGTKMVFNVIYRPPNGSVPEFISEFEKQVLELEKSEKKVIYLGDFNIWMDDINNTDTIRMNNFLKVFSLKNHIVTPTYNSGHILDLVICHRNFPLIKNVTVDQLAVISDHKAIFFNIDISIKQKVDKIIRFRRSNPNFPKNLNRILTSSMISNNIVCEHSVPPCISCYVNYFRLITGKVFDECCPYVTKTIQVVDKSKNWYSAEVRNANKNLRKAEKKYRTRSTIDNLNDFKRLRNIKCQTIALAKRDYLHKSISECSNNPRKIYNHLNNFLGKPSKEMALPNHESKLDLSNLFKDFFIDKINKIVAAFDFNIPSPHLNPDLPINPVFNFNPITDEDALSIIKDMNSTYCLNDPFDIKKTRC